MPWFAMAFEIILWIMFISLAFNLIYLVVGYATFFIQKQGCISWVLFAVNTLLIVVLLILAVFGIIIAYFPEIFSMNQLDDNQLVKFGIISIVSLILNFLFAFYLQLASFYFTVVIKGETLIMFCTKWKRDNKRIVRLGRYWLKYQTLVWNGRFKIQHFVFAKSRIVRYLNSKGATELLWAGGNEHV